MTPVAGQYATLNSMPSGSNFWIMQLMLGKLHLNLLYLHSLVSIGTPALMDYLLDLLLNLCI